MKLKDTRRIQLEKLTLEDFRPLLEENIGTREMAVRLLGNHRWAAPVRQKLIELGVSKESLDLRTKQLGLAAVRAQGDKVRAESVQRMREKAPEIFLENSPYSGARIRQIVHHYNKHFGWLEYRCQECGNEGSYNGKKLSLQIDHKNGRHRDNRLENLRFLCPNCHAQSDTFCSKNIGNRNS